MLFTCCNFVSLFKSNGTHKEMSECRFTEDDVLSDDNPEELSIPDAPSSLRSTASVVVKKCKRIAGYFHRSTKANELLKRECAARNLTFYRLVQCVETRWNSLYLMMMRIRNCVDCIEFVLIKLKANSVVEPLTQDELDILSDIILCLKPFADSTEELGGEK